MHKYLLVVGAIVSMVTFLWIDEVRLTFGLLLTAAHVNEVMFKNLESVNWKSICSTWVHKLFESHKPVLLLLNPSESGRPVFVSYMDKTTSGFAFKAEQINLWISFFWFIKLIVLFDSIITLLTLIPNIGYTEIITM